MKYQKLILLLLAIGLAPMIRAQAPTSFYEHYTGLISEEVKLTADLVKVKDGFAGYYYYEFNEEGSWISSKPIALDGYLDDQHQFVLNEFGGQTSFFQGTLENTQLITGQWVNKNLKEEVNFTLKATYAPGTIPLQLVEEHETRTLAGQTYPQAEFHVALLFPTAQLDPAAYYQLNERIYQLIGYRGAVDPKKNRIKILEEAYFQQFESSLAQINTDSFPDQLNWEKSIRMDVINNESSLLCLQIETFAKTGNREGTQVKKYLVFDLEENKLLQLTDFFSEEKTMEVRQFLDLRLREHYKLDSLQSLTALGFFNDEIEATRNFYVHPGGIGFYYNVFEIAPFSNGPTDLFIPWAEIEAFLMEDHPFGAFIHR